MTDRIAGSARGTGGSPWWNAPVTAVLLAALAATPARTRAAAAEAPAPAAPEPAAQEPVSRSDVSAVLGRQVWDAGGDAVGRIVDILVDGAGAVRAAVVDVGGFMGLGQRRVAITWTALHFTPGGDKITLDLKADQVAAMPEYKPAGTGPVVVAAPKPPSPDHPAQQPAAPK
jgi:hypothetical protein